jgi:hypothetical protein
MKKFKELSDDINNVQDLDIEKLKNGEYEIESIVDIVVDPKDLVQENQGMVATNMNINKDVKRGDLLYLVAMVRKSGTTSFSSPSTQCVIKVRVVDLYKGLTYLNKVLK